MGKIILNDIEYGIGISNGVNVDTTNLVKKDSIVTTLDDTVTDKQIPSAKAVYDKLSDLPNDSGLKCYTTLNELGLTAPVTVGEIFNAMPKKTMAVIACEAKDDTEGTVTISDIPTSFGVLTIKKNELGRFSIEYQNSLQGSPCDVKRWIGTLKGLDGTGLIWKLVSTQVTYVALSDMGLTVDATIQDVIDKVQVGETALLRTDVFTNWSTLFNGIQWGYLKVEKTISNLCNIELQEVVTPNRRYFGTQSSGKFNKWQQVASEITDVLDNRSNFNQIPNANLVAREIYGKYFDIANYSNALTMPAGKWRVDSNDKASQMQNLPVKKAGILEVKYLHGNDGQTAYTSTFKYAMLTYTVISGEKYERSFNSDGTVGNIVNDTGWRTVIIEDASADPYSCSGYKKLTGTEDLFTLPCGHYASDKANTAYNYPVTDSTNLLAHIYVLGCLNEPTNNKGFRIILYFDNKNRMYRINEWWGNFVNNGWQNMQAIGNGGNSDVYSTSEQAIGTWVDGKTIYRKTIVKDSHSANAELISGVGTFIRGYGSCLLSGHVYNVPYCGLLYGHLEDEKYTYLNFRLNENTGSLSTIGSGTYAIKNLKVTLEYTKR